MIIMGILFFIFGFVTWLNGSLIPFLKVICNLNEFEALFVTFAFYIAYTLMALPMAYVLERTGYKKGMMFGLAIMASGSLLFIPAALSGEFFVFLLALFLLGSGLTLLQTASNPYIVLLGPIESAAMRISIMGLVNKSAGVLAPIAFTALILSGMGSLQDLSAAEIDVVAHKLIIPYLVMAMILIALVFLIKYSSLEELAFESSTEDETNIFAYPKVVLGAVALFFYIGIEVIAGDTIGLYGASLGVQNATSLTSYTMVFMVLGYIVGVVCIPKYLSQEKALIGSSLLGILLLFGVSFSSATDALFLSLPNTLLFVALLGFSNALVWPTIWPLALDGMGKHTPKASALLIMAIAGGALLPLAFGKIAQLSGSMQSSYLYGSVCYLFILVYALKWHKMDSWSRNN